MRAPARGHILSQGTARHERQQLKALERAEVSMMVNENDVFLSCELEPGKFADALTTTSSHDHARDTAYSVHS